MSLKETVLTQINKPAIRIKLAMALKVTEQTIIIYITRKSDNLTKAASLKVIREELGIPDEAILEDSVTEGAAK